jgi:hypothetical protein
VSSPIQLADDVSLFVLESQGVFFSGPDQEIRAFNTPATYIWCSLEEGLGPDEIADAYAERFDTPWDEARGRVAKLVREWQSHGYLKGSASEPFEPRERVAPPRGVRAPFAAAELGASQASGGWTRGSARLRRRGPGLRSRLNPSAALARRYRLLDTGFWVRFETRVQESRIHPVLAHLEAEGACDVELEIRRAGAGAVLLQHSVATERCESLDCLAPMVKAAVWEIAVNRHRYFMEIHAGVVSDGDACILLPGAPGSGKSTLTAALIASGFQYLSDEVALLQEETLNVRPLPLALTVKAGSVPLLSRLHPGLRERRTHVRQDERVVRYLNPPADALADPTRDQPVSRIVFPRVGPETRLRSITRPDALQRLLRECLVLPEWLDADKVRRLVVWMRSVECFELSVASLEEAVEAIRQTASPSECR